MSLAQGRSLSIFKGQNNVRDLTKTKALSCTCAHIWLVCSVSWRSVNIVMTLVNISDELAYKLI